MMNTIYIYVYIISFSWGDGNEYGRKDSSKHLLTAVACFQYILLFFKIV
jgi:hypothetical protein